MAAEADAEVPSWTASSGRFNRSIEWWMGSAHGDTDPIRGDCDLTRHFVRVSESGNWIISWPRVGQGIVEMCVGDAPAPSLFS